MIKNSRLMLLFLLSCVLSGCLPVIFAGAGTSALQFAKDRPANNTVSDIRISSAISAEFMKTGFKNLYSKISVSVFMGRVLLTGYVDQESDMQKAIKIAESQDGVVEVLNELIALDGKVKFDAGQYARDTLITTQIKSKIMVDRDIRTINYMVITFDSVVYLFGAARNEEELQKAANIASNIRSVKKVVSHVIIVDNFHSLKEKTPKTPSTSSNEILVKDIDAEFDKY